MNYLIKSLNVALPERISKVVENAETAFVKRPVDKPIFLSKINFDGDGQGDLKHHGGVDKAVCVYPFEHYSYWAKQYNQKFSIPSFGENITIEGLNEQNAAIGDILKIGEAVVQVSQPRQPCYKIANIHGLKDIPAKITETGFSGFYLRVLQEGVVNPTDCLELIERLNPEITVSFVNQIKYHDSSNVKAMQKIIEAPGLAENVKESFSRKLKGSEA